MTAALKPYFDYRTVRGYLAASVAAMLPDVDIQWNPGPPNYERATDTVGRAVVITVGGGPGLILEGTIDRVSVSLDIAGDQLDYESAADLARAVDLAAVRVARGPVVINGTRVYGVVRAGGRPTPIGVDSADRHHFSVSHVWAVESGV